MRPVILLLLLVSIGLTSFSTAFGETKDQTIPQILSASNDFLDLVRQYWPKIGSGDLQAMTVSYEALNNCANFKDEISAADNVDDLEASLQGRHPETIRFGKGVYFKCKRLVEHYAEFPGWRGLRLQAALAGDIRSKIWLVRQYYHNKDKRPREDFPYSPGAFLIDAMTAGHPMVFGVIASSAPYYDLLQDKSQTTVVAWWLLSCKYRDDCDKPESLTTYCIFMSPECIAFENLLDLYRQRAGSDEVYAAAQRLADDLYLKVQQRRFQELGLNLVW